MTREATGLPQEPKPRSPWVALATDFGYLLLTSVLMFGGGGYWVDRRRSAEIPWFTFAGILLGLAVAFQSLIRRLGELERREKARDRSGNDRKHQGPSPR